MRPSPALARYATPVSGLFLGSTGSHGGGGVDCAGGLLGAEALLGAGRRR
jgi:phytoene dehydrogenase-like protein